MILPYLYLYLYLYLFNLKEREHVPKNHVAFLHEYNRRQSQGIIKSRIHNLNLFYNFSSGIL